MQALPPMLSPRRRSHLLLFVLTMTLCLGACGSAPVNSYYTLENIMPDAEKLPKSPLCNGVLAVESVVVSPPYDLTKIVFRPDDLEVRYYTHRHWVCSPEEMMGKLLIRRLEVENIFADVDSLVFLSEPDLTLFAKVHNLEEVDRARNWNGRLAMSFSLRDDITRKTVWEYSFDETNDSSNNDVKAVIRSINDIYNSQIKKVIHELKLFVTRYKRCSGNSNSSE
jgi:ABC-type uncharacterized transport system auxiliary subunit